MVIGGGGDSGNVVSVLRDKVGLDEVQRADTIDIVNCSKSRKFWLTYNRGTIKGDFSYLCNI